MAETPNDKSRNSDQEIRETYRTAFLAVDWHFEPRRLRDMGPAERLEYDIHLAEKIRRLQAAQEELAIIMTANGITFEGESPRVIINRTHNPDKYQEL